MLFVGKLFLIYLGLAGVLYLFARFVHSYFYTEVPSSLTWRAPTAAGAVWLLALGWPLFLNQSIEKRWPVSFNDLFLFSSGKNALEFGEFVVEQPGGRQVKYVRRKNTRGLLEYLDAENRPLPATEPVVIATDAEGNKHRFEIVKDKDGNIARSSGGLVDRPQGVRYRSDSGLVMEAETFGSIPASGYGQFFLTLLGALVTAATWFLALWLLLLFQWPHALGLTVPLMLVWAFAMNLAL